jgi:hypothetical protein
MGTSHDVALSGSYAYVTDYYQGSGLQVIDITNPESPQNLGGADGPVNNWGVCQHRFSLSAFHRFRMSPWFKIF